MKRVDVGSGGSADPLVGFGHFLIIAKQKILFGAPRLQKFDLDLAAQLKNGPRSLRGLPVAGDLGLGIHMHAADEDDAGDTDDADRCNLVS